MPLTQPDAPPSVGRGAPSPTGPGAIASVQRREPASVGRPGATTSAVDASQLRPDEVTTMS